LSKLEEDLINRTEVMPILEEIIRQDNEITEMLNRKIDNLRSSLTNASQKRKVRHNYNRKEERNEPRFLDQKG
jgi:flagellar biosynthesis chaperone FliJ